MLSTITNIACAKSDCDNPVTVKGVRNGKPYPSHCPKHVHDKHSARTSRSLTQRAGRTCIGWSCPMPDRIFTATHPNQRTCEHCRKDHIYTHNFNELREFTGWTDALAYMAERLDPSPRLVRGFDTEGFGSGWMHKQQLAVLGEDALAVDNPLTDRLDWGDVFQFLYDRNTGELNVSFFMDYDLGQLFGPLGQNRNGALPWDRAKILFRPEEVAKRHWKDGRDPFPATFEDSKGRVWDVDMLVGGRMLKFKPRYCRCKIQDKRGRWMTHYYCEHARKLDYFYLCDVRQFFGGPLTSILDDPTVGTPEDRAKVISGKENRNNATLSPETVAYTQAENRILAEAVQRQDVAMRRMGISLPRSRFIGPGYAMQQWMNKQNIITADRLRESVPPDVLLAAHGAYFGGWQEVICPGYIPGKSYQYDLNSAYASIIADLPCLEREHGQWVHGTGTPGPLPRGHLRLAHVDGQAPDVDPAMPNVSAVFGPFPHRSKRGRVTRPLHSSGWHWQERINDAIAAGVLDPDRLVYSEWWEYTPACSCPPPLHRITEFWTERQRYPKGSVENKLMRLLSSSVYGKFEQSIGDVTGRYYNLIYAGLITARCDSRIHEAIRTHPDGQDAVIEIATDSVFFRTPHTGLNVDKEKLGAWKASEHEDLCIFQRGMRWEGNKPLKSRGVKASDIDRLIEKATPALKGLHELKDKPYKISPFTIPITIAFSATSIGEASQQANGSNWDDCGSVRNDVPVELAFEWRAYRDVDIWFDNRMGMFRTSPMIEGLGDVESAPYGTKQVREEYRNKNWGCNPDGSNYEQVRDGLRQ